jgi:hypothetical protein
MPLAFNPTNSPLAERLLATRRRCLGRIDLPVSDVADDKFYIKKSYAGTLNTHLHNFQIGT